jgi:hypothetical protein
MDEFEVLEGVRLYGHDPYYHGHDYEMAQAHMLGLKHEEPKRCLVGRVPYPLKKVEVNLDPALKEKWIEALGAGHYRTHRAIHDHADFINPLFLEALAGLEEYAKANDQPPEEHDICVKRDFTREDMERLFRDFGVDNEPEQPTPVKDGAVKKFLKLEFLDTKATALFTGAAVLLGLLTFATCNWWSLDLETAKKATILEQAANKYDGDRTPGYLEAADLCDKIGHHERAKLLREYVAAKDFEKVVKAEEFRSLEYPTGLVGTRGGGLSVMWIAGALAEGFLLMFGWLFQCEHYDTYKYKRRNS